MYKATYLFLFILVLLITSAFLIQRQNLSKQAAVKKIKSVSKKSTKSDFTKESIFPSRWSATPKDTYIKGQLLVHLKNKLDVNLQLDKNNKFSFGTKNIINKSGNHTQLISYLNKINTKTITSLFSINYDFPGFKDLANLYLVTFDNKEDEKKIISDFKKRQGVIDAQFNYKYDMYQFPLELNDPYYLDHYPNNVSNRDPAWNPAFDYQWNLKKIGIDKDILNQASAFEKVIVAVPDTGVYAAHEEFGSCDLVDSFKKDSCETLVPGRDFTDEGDIWGHGTFIAGIIAAKYGNEFGMAGIAANAKILPLRVAGGGCVRRGEGGTCAYPFATTDTFVQAIVYATARKARVINMSWGSYNNPDTFLDTAVNIAYNNGALLIASAGNDDFNVDRFENRKPTSITCKTPTGELEDCVIVVGSSSEKDEKSNFSNWGGGLDVVAPGGGDENLLSVDWDWTKFDNSFLNILSLNWFWFWNQNHTQGEWWTRSNQIHEQFARSAGTSFSAPHVAALAALILGKKPELSAKEVRNVIINSSDDIKPDLYGIGFDDKTGYGRINAKRALEEMDTATPPRAYISQPTNGFVSGQKLQIKGTARAEQFSKYFIEYTHYPDRSNFESEGISYSQSGGGAPVNNGLLAEFDFSGRSAGQYIFKLTVESLNGKKTSTERRIYYDERVKPGWPYVSKDFLKNNSLNIIPVVSDLNNDRKKEIIYLVDHNKILIANSDGNINTDWAKTNDEIAQIPAIVDFDERNCEINCTKEIIYGTLEEHLEAPTFSPETVNLIDVTNLNLKKINNWTINNAADDYRSFPILAIDDIDNNGKPNVLAEYREHWQPEAKINIYEDPIKPATNIKILNSDDSIYPRDSRQTSLLVGNIDRDSEKEIIVSQGYPNRFVKRDEQGMGKEFVGDQKIFGFKASGQPIPNWSPKIVRGHQSGNTLLGNFDDDPELEIVTDNQDTYNNPIKVLILDGDGSMVGSFTTAQTERVSLTLGDFDYDGKVDVLVDEHNGKLEVINGKGKLIASGSDPYFYSRKRVEENEYEKVYVLQESRMQYIDTVVGDIDSDGYKEFIKHGKEGGQNKIFFYRVVGDKIVSDVYPSFNAQEGPYSQLALADVDDDGKTDLITANRNQDFASLYAIDLGTKMGILDWPQFLQNERHTGAYVPSDMTEDREWSFTLEPVCGDPKFDKKRPNQQTKFWYQIGNSAPKIGELKLGTQILELVQEADETMIYIGLASSKQEFLSLFKKPHHLMNFGEPLVAGQKLISFKAKDLPSGDYPISFLAKPSWCSQPISLPTPKTSQRN